MVLVSDPPNPVIGLQTRGLALMWDGAEKLARIHYVEWTNHTRIQPALSSLRTNENKTTLMNKCGV